MNLKEIVETGTIESLPKFDNRDVGVIKFGNERIIITIVDNSWYMRYSEKIHIEETLVV